MKKNDLFSSEFKLRLLIREAIKIRNKQHMSEQQELRTVIRHLIKEGEIDADAEPAPYASTPVNALADAFNEILKILKGGLRKMNQPEERLSYRAHILEKFKSIFDSFEGLDVQVSAKAIGEGDLTEQEEDTADTKLKVTLDDPDRIMPSDGAEDIRFKEKEKDPEEELETNFDAFKIAGENPTGARFAFETVNNSNIEQVLSDKRKLLFSPEYKKEFKDYALYNVDLWLLTYEKELADSLGQEPAFTETVVSKPSGAEISGTAQEFEMGSPEEFEMPELPELPEEGVA